MELKIFETYELLSEAAAKEILFVVKKKPTAVICLAGGDTPLRTYQILVRQAKEYHIDFSKVHFVGLDEWIGIPSSNSGSCQFFINKNIIAPLQIDANHLHLFNAMSNDLEAECRKMDGVISKLGGIDLMLVGIGMNGHVGFNEPGISFRLKSHVVELDQITTQVGQKYFKTEIELKKGITLGMQNLQEAKEVILLASGDKKSSIVKQMMEEEINEYLPASLIRAHANSKVFLDGASAHELQTNDC